MRLFQMTIVKQFLLLQLDVRTILNFAGLAQPFRTLKPRLKATFHLNPPLTQQKEFAARVSEIRAMQPNQRRLDDLFQSMLHRVFNGAANAQTTGVVPTMVRCQYGAWASAFVTFLATKHSV